MEWPARLPPVGGGGMSHMAKTSSSGAKIWEGRTNEANM